MDILSGWWGGKNTVNDKPKQSKSAPTDDIATGDDQVQQHLSIHNMDAAGTMMGSRDREGTGNESTNPKDKPTAMPARTEGEGDDNHTRTPSTDGNDDNGGDNKDTEREETRQPPKKHTSATAASMARITKEDAAEAAEAALNSAYNFGNFLLKKVSATATIIQKTVEEQTIVGDFQKEQQKFVKEKHSKRSDAAVPPWVGYNEEEQMKEQILALSRDKRNFLRNPPAGVQFHFEFNAIFPVAMATLKEDNNLQKMRFELVPKKITEENFWRNYFYRVSLIKQSSQLTSLAAKSGEGRRGSGSTSHSSSENLSQKGDKTPPIDVKSAQGVTPSAANIGAEEEQLDIATPDSPPGSEFISDAFNSELDEAELKKGMEQLGMDKKDGEVTEDEVPEWEKELQQELQDYEVVGEGDENEEWEREINQMLEDEAGLE